ncbi:MAG TPA: M14 family zinc carboxypeptidase [Longimicrobiales bacterium]
MSGPGTVAVMRPIGRIPRRGTFALTAFMYATAVALPSALSAQAAAQAARPVAAQPGRGVQAIDQEYTAKIAEYLTDPRISTELVDHLPASNTVPTPLKFFGRIVGTPGELTYAKDIHRYMEAVAKAAPARAKYWTIGKTEEGRDMIVLAISDEETMRNLETYKDYLHSLTDARVTTDAQAQDIISRAKPIYYITSGMHSPERGGPEMLMEMAYRLVVEETPFIQNIRKNVITFITPVIEVDGREKMVDTYYFNKKNAPAAGAGGGRGGGANQLPLMYWGKYVQHDNNRDGMGQFLALTKNTNDTWLEWTPTVLHDLHEAQTYLYSSTGTGPYNDAVDPITVDEWWLLAKNDVLEMTKRGVPGVWTYGFYDGWTPNYMFFLAHTKNAIGRFYEVQSYGPDNYDVNPGATTTSREWFRPNPPLPSIKWGPRANVNIQQSALLFSLNNVANNREMYLDNYWRKSQRAVNKGKTGPVFGWVIPAQQHAKANAAEAVNDLRRQGLEFHTATGAFRVGNLDVKPGDYIIRGDQPFRTIADMYFPLQNYSPTNPNPYDDTGWTFPLMRNITIAPIGDAKLLSQSMKPVTADVRAPGGVTGSGNTIVVANTSDNNLVTFRFRFPQVKMHAAEAPFTAGGASFLAGSVIIPNANRAQLEPVLRELGLSATAVATAPGVPSHELDVPRIGYVHSWTRTQDEGWVRAAFDHYGVPYHYFGEPLLKEGNLRAKYDVIVYPHGGSGYSPPAQGAGAGAGAGGGAGGSAGNAASADDRPIPYMRTAEFQAIGYPDSTADIRGGVGAEGMKALYEFVQQGGTLITEGGTAALFPNLNLAPGVKVETPSGLFARGTILRGIVSDMKSPLMYGYEHDELPIYFNSAPVINAGAGAQPVTANANPSRRQVVTPMATELELSPWDPSGTGVAYGVPIGAPVDTAARPGRGQGAGFGGGGRGGRGGDAGAAGVPGLTPDTRTSTRVVMQFPEKESDMLLSGTLDGGEVLSRRAQLVDQKIGNGHVVMFAFRPFWRWQTQGTYAIGFNALLNWNDLDAGK